MRSFGMLTARAFWMVRRNTGLDAGSVPPAFTTMVMSFAMRANCFAMRFHRANIVCFRTSKIRPMGWMVHERQGACQPRLTWASSMERVNEGRNIAPRRGGRKPNTMSRSPRDNHPGAYSMISPNRFFAIAVGVLLISASLALPQGSRAADAPGKALVALYRVAPGKHLDFLKWMAAREAVDKEAGMPATQWYMHTNGDSWDFLAIAPALTEAQQAKVDALATKKGLKTGLQASLEFR